MIIKSEEKKEFWHIDVTEKEQGFLNERQKPRAVYQSVQFR